jgi:demethylmenaquinone methyltransferase/2-methoxy-6-polyprenyl-1,4-benzoquinol methylase
VQVDLPLPVANAGELAAKAGFGLSCDPEVGRLLAVLAAAVPAGGRILELGTGFGVGTAWMIHGLAGRGDVELITVDHSAEQLTEAARAGWPTYVKILVGDAVESTAANGTFDLIFADAEGGKWDGLDVTIRALRPRGHLLVDDMTPPRFAHELHASKTAEVRQTLLNHPALLAVPIDWASGLILATRHA